MNISDAGIRNENYNYRTDFVAGTSSDASERSYANVNIGQQFSGKILDITNGNVKLQLMNNEIIDARLAQSLSLNIGDELSFMVKDKDGSSIYIKPVSEAAELSRNNALLKILDANNLSATEKNLNIAESLMRHSMPVDRASMQRVMQHAYKYSDAPIDNIVNMVKHNIPVNSSTIAQYQDMLNNVHQLTGNIHELSDNLYQVFDKTPDKILGIISDQQDMANISLPDVEDTTVPNSMQNNLSETAQNSMPVSENTDAIKSAADIQENVTDASAAINNEVQAKELATSLSDKFKLDSSSSLQLVKSLEEAGIGTEKVKELVTKSETPLQLVNNINELLSKLPKADNTQSFSDIIKSEGFKELFKTAVNRKLMLNSSDMEKPEELNELYKGIYEKTQKLLDAFSGGQEQNSEQLKQSAKSVQERIDFMQNLNDMYGYAQLPVNVSGNDMNSELYVYMNKHKKLEAGKDISALLHLDMEHLGATDVHVSCSGTVVHTRFYVEDEESARIIDEHMTMLEKAITQRGFSLTNEVIARTQEEATKNMVVDEMLDIDLEKSVRRYSFDVKM